MYTSCKQNGDMEVNVFGGLNILPFCKQLLGENGLLKHLGRVGLAELKMGEIMLSELVVSIL